MAAVLVAAACTDPGVPPEFTRSVLTHRGEHLVLDVAAAAPDGTPADIACTGAMTASGVGTILDSVPVVHHDTARVLTVRCEAEADGVRAKPVEPYYQMYGPDLRGTWQGWVGPCQVTLTIRRPGEPRGNSGTLLMGVELLNLENVIARLIDRPEGDSVQFYGETGWMPYNAKGSYADYASQEFRRLTVGTGAYGTRCGGGSIETKNRLGPN
jgi:hypothetical protein